MVCDYSMSQKEFTDLVVRKEAIELYQKIALIVAYDSFKKYFFKDQILRAALSVSNNIAEWYERETKKELIRFLSEVVVK